MFAEQHVVHLGRVDHEHHQSLQTNRQPSSLCHRLSTSGNQFIPRSFPQFRAAHDVPGFDQIKCRPHAH